MAMELERRLHDERIGVLWRQAAAELALGRSAGATLEEMIREQDKCEAFGCFRTSVWRSACS